MDNLGRTLDGIAGPLLHACAVDVLLAMLYSRMSCRVPLISYSSCHGITIITHVKGHPRDGLIMGDVGLFEQLQGQSFVVELQREDGTRGRPGADHQVVFHCYNVCSGEVGME